MSNEFSKSCDMCKRTTNNKKTCTDCIKYLNDVPDDVYMMYQKLEYKLIKKMR